MKKNKIILVMSILLLSILIFAIASKMNSSTENDKTINSYNAENSTGNKKTINSYDAEISKIYVEFMADTEDYDKLNKITELSKNYEIYKISNEKHDIDTNFTVKINAMKDYFIKKNDVVINNNTLADIEKIEDKGKLMTCSNNLANVLATIKNERTVIYTDEQVDSYKNSINTLIESCDSRVKAIDKVMIEAQEASEAKAKADKK